MALDTQRPQRTETRRAALALYLSLLANVVVFFYKPLFSSHYIFPWDFRGVQFPLITFLTDELRQGRFPLWNPYSYCGYPIFANIEACFFHPLILLSAFLAAHTSLDLAKLLEWAVVLQLWGAGVAAFHLLREFGCKRAPAWTGAIIFQTGGYFASRAEHIGAMMAVAWMPLAWLAVLHLSRGFNRRWFAILSAALGMAILGGFPQPTLSVFVSTVVFSIVLAVLRLTRLRTFMITCAAAAVGVAFAAVQFIPTFQLTQWSVAKFRAGWLGDGGGLYWQSLVSLVMPNYYNLFDMSKFHGPGDISFLYLYCSIAGLLLAIYALIRFERRMAPLAMMTLFGFVWMLGEHEPLWRLVYPWLPETIRIGIHPEYTYGIFCLGVASLAAMGLDLLPMPESRRYLVGAVIAADLFLTGSGRPMNMASLDREPGVTRDSFHGSAALLRDVRAFTASQNPPWRIDNTGDVDLDWSIQAPIPRIATANGVSPLALEEIIQLRLFLHDGHPWGWYYPIEKLDSPILDLLNVRYVISGPKEAPRLAKSTRFRHAADLDQGYQLFENTTAMPRFFLVHQVIEERSLDESRRAIETGAVDLHHTAIIDAPMALSKDGSVGTVTVSDYQPGLVELHIDAPQNSLLVMSENYYPGWKAWVDNVAVEIHRVDIAFRGVVVPAGTHTVRMEFRPIIFPISLSISLATPALLGWLGLRRRS